jgi:type 2 lantibiotic biosynthesis protein LanM
VDVHQENLIAAGEHPVLIDAECLLSAMPEAQEHGLGLIRSGLLPAWSFAGRSGLPRNTGGLGPEPYPGAAGRRHLPVLNGQVADIRAHVDAVRQGFTATTAGWLARRDWLLDAAASPLQALQGARIRFVPRQTQAYALVLRSAATPTGLSDGRAFGIRLDALARGRLETSPPAPEAELVAAEREALARLDIPAFELRTDSTDVHLRGGGPTGFHVPRPAWPALRARLAEMSEAEVAAQASLLALALAAPSPVPPLPDAPVGSDALLIEAARQIAQALVDEALPGHDGAPAWLGPELDAGLEQVRDNLQHDLYGGTAGIALFLAAAARLAGAARGGPLALAALASLPRRFRNADGLGYGRGLGGMLTALVHGAALLGAPALLDQALALAVRAPAIAATGRDDLLQGRPGAILALLMLHEATGESAPRDAAIALGQALLPRLEGLPPAALLGTGLTGLSHGASGIALAMLALHECTGAAVWQGPALAGFAVERRQFDRQAANWPDLRHKAPARVFGGSWCHGAPGIALARLAALRALPEGQPDRAALREEAELALATTATLGEAIDDGLCCGTAGRAEVLLLGGIGLGRPDLLTAARRMMEGVLRRGVGDAYRLRPARPAGPVNPSLFTGRAGLGYQALRILAPTALPSLLLPRFPQPGPIGTRRDIPPA